MNLIYRKGIVALGLATAATTVHAGTVITTNLPAGTSIVNIDGRNDGASGYDGGQNHWYQPFAVNGQLLELTVNPGTYTFSLIDPTDAAVKFPSLTSSQLSQIGTAWSYNTPYVTDYYVFDSSAATDPNQSELFSGAVEGRIPNWNTYPGAINGGYDNAIDSYNAAVTGGVSDKVFVGGRFTGAELSSYTFTKQQTLIFVIPDYALGDNNSAVSVVVHDVNAVPEPASMTVLATMVGGLLARRRRAK